MSDRQVVADHVDVEKLFHALEMVNPQQIVVAPDGIIAGLAGTNSDAEDETETSANPR